MTGKERLGTAHKGEKIINNTVQNKTNYIWIKLFFLLFILGITFILYESGVFHFFADKERLKSFLQSLGPLSFAGFIVLQALQVVAAPVPGEVTGFIGGFIYGPVLGIFLSTIGLTIGSWLAFSLARIFGRPFVEKFVKKETLLKYNYLLHHKGAFLVFMLFLIPGFPKDILCYIIGLGQLTTKEFLVISTTGRFGGTVLLTLGGAYIRQQQYYRFSILIGIAIVIVFLAMLYKDKLEKIFRKLHLESIRKKRKK